jgi:hypothetical protein
VRRVAYRILPVAIALGILAAAPAQATRIPVPADFYGVNFQRMAKLGPAALDVHLAKIESLGITEVRFNVSWAAIEPLSPTNGVHEYRWGLTDQEVTAMARHRVRPDPTLTQTPDWAAVQGTWVDLQCAKASSRAPVSADPYARFVRAFASRYGRNGSFWASHPNVPYIPVLRYEIWNEPNLKGGWCPRPQPWLYADMFVEAANAVRDVDPQALLSTGGVAIPSKPSQQYLTIADFFGRATARRPGIVDLMSSAAVHIYPSTDTQKMLDKLAGFRSQLHSGRIPDRTPMLINEIGWATQVGKTPVSESDREKAYGKMTVNFARTRCNVGGIFPHTWISPQQSKSNPEDWYGIANPSTAEPYASALSYSYGLRLMTGQLATAPPTRILQVC